ncbi:MAG: Gfo/Idh/MocA family protein [Bacillota bacterium]
MNKVRIGMIGVGQIAKQGHLEQYLKGNEPVEFVAACDINRQELDSVCEHYGIPNKYADFRDLLQRDDIDAVDVCLHNNLHAPVAIAALRAGKHVYCEKPIAGSYSDGAEMVRTAKECGKFLHIQLGALYSPEVRAAKTLISEGALGRIYHARSTGYRRRGRPYVDGYGTKYFVNKESCGGGALYDMGVYHISQMLYLMESPNVRRISGKICQETEMYEQRRAESGYNVEELGLGFVKFENDVTMDIIESWAVHMNPFESSSIFGSRGGIRMNPFEYYTTFHDMEMNAAFDLGRWDWRRRMCFEDADLYDSSIHHWVAALQGRVDLLPTAELALETMLIQEAIYMSDRMGREVTAGEVMENSKSTALEV